MDAQTHRSVVCCELTHSVVCTYGEVRLKVTGSSMLPAIWPGDEITVVRTEYVALQPGQILLYHRNNGLTAHRIRQIERDYLITCGDSLLYPDAPVRPGEVVGRVVSILRNGRSICLKPSHASSILARILCRSNFSRRFALHLIHRSVRHYNQSLSYHGDMHITWVR
jgi:hypothetical protein